MEQPYRDPTAPVALNVGEELTIFMTDRRPVTVSERDWPVLASASCTVNDSNTHFFACVRQHADGRRLVYGWRWRKGHQSPERSAGYLAESDANDARRERQTLHWLELVEIIVGAQRHGVNLAERCINALPAERL